MQQRIAVRVDASIARFPQLPQLPRLLIFVTSELRRQTDRGVRISQSVSRRRHRHRLTAGRLINVMEIFIHHNTVETKLKAALN